MSTTTRGPTLPAAIALGPLARARGTVPLPGSKSISNRTLLLAALAEGTTTLRNLLDAEDTDRMLEALTALGCHVRYLGREGFPPLAIGPGGAGAGANVRIRADVSSQFLSALLLALPLVRESELRSTTVTLTTPLISQPYVAMTMNLMQRF